MITKVLPDANVLYSRTLRDWLFILRNKTGGRMFTVHYTEDILAETIHSYRRAHPHLSGGKITRLHDHLQAQMDSRIDDFVASPHGGPTDVHDHHVHAAALGGDITLVLSEDRDFLGLAGEQLDTLPYEVYSTDDFFVLVDDSHPSAVSAGTSYQLGYWLQRSNGEADLPEALRRAHCPAFAARVRHHLQGAL